MVISAGAIAPPAGPRVARLAKASGDWILQVQAASVERKRDSVRSSLLARQRLRPEADVTPDALYPEAMALVTIGQPDVAVARLEPVLLRRGWLELMLNDPVNTAALLRCAQLRAELSGAPRDKRKSRQWSGLVSQLWKTPDPQLADVSRKMLGLAQN